MKKLILCAAFVAAIVLGANAQEYKHVSPVSVQLIEFNLDTIHAWAANLEGELAELTALQKNLTSEQKAIASAQNSLKSEKKIYDALASFLKTRKGQINEEKKFYQSEIKQYDAYVKDVKKQLETLQKIDDVKCPAIQNQIRRLEGVKKDCDHSKDRCEKILSEIAKYDEADVAKGYEDLNEFLTELTDKGARLTNLATLNKAHIAAVKTQIKNVKAQIKAAGK